MKIDNEYDMMIIITSIVTILTLIITGLSFSFSKEISEKQDEKINRVLTKIQDIEILQLKKISSDIDNLINISKELKESPEEIIYKITYFNERLITLIENTPLSICTEPQN